MRQVSTHDNPFTAAIAGSLTGHQPVADLAPARPLTWWINVHTGDLLDTDALAAARQQAHQLYETNAHIFEDEFDALSALGVMPVHDLGERDSVLVSAASCVPA